MAFAFITLAVVAAVIFVLLLAAAFVTKEEVKKRTFKVPAKGTGREPPAVPIPNAFASEGKRNDMGYTGSGAIH